MSANLPVIPMRGSVLLPGVTLPIAAARPATLRAIEAALGGNRRVFAVAQRVDSEEVVPESLYTIGTIATIESVQRGLGGIRLALEGQERGIALRVAPVKLPFSWPKISLSISCGEIAPQLTGRNTSL